MKLQEKIYEESAPGLVLCAVFNCDDDDDDDVVVVVCLRVPSLFVGRILAPAFFFLFLLVCIFANVSYFPICLFLLSTRLCRTHMYNPQEAHGALAFRWLLALIIGILVGLLGFILYYCIDLLQMLKFNLVGSCMYRCVYVDGAVLYVCYVLCVF